MLLMTLTVLNLHDTDSFHFLWVSCALTVYASVYQNALEKQNNM